MPDTPHRTSTLADGTRVVEKFTGNVAIPSQFNDDRKWTAVMDLKPDEVYAGFVRAAPDVSVVAHPRADADGVLIEIAGMHFGIPTEQAEALIPVLQAAIDKKKAQRAQRAEAARTVPEG